MIIEITSGDLDNLLKGATDNNVALTYQRLCDGKCFDTFYDLVISLQEEGILGYDIIGDIKVGSISVTDENPYETELCYPLNEELNPIIA